MSVAQKMPDAAPVRVSTAGTLVAGRVATAWLFGLLPSGS